jgi:hypothetical protein
MTKRDPIDKWLLHNGCYSKERALRILVARQTREAIHFALAMGVGFGRRHDVVKVYRKYAKQKYGKS